MFVMNHSFVVYLTKLLEALTTQRRLSESSGILAEYSIA
jgi:hypothetical protein